ncbi:hypothetical protein [Agromyces sp. Root81]|uniref:hypothetical protein n=1 Tax=Agromyces sp. Root81 TaxID=1736601 RepID=UPI0006F23E3B|nr:hypothetical protein [Agromyces sp. Root81]
MKELDRAVIRRLRRELVRSTYVDGAAAMRDVSRIALFAAVPRAAREHLAVRREVITDLNRARSTRPDAAGVQHAGESSPVKLATRLHDILLLNAAWLAILSAGLTMPVPRKDGHTLLPIEDWALVSGIATGLVLALLVWLEPYRTSTRWWPIGGWPASLTLGFGIYWIFVGVSIPWRWEPNPDDAVAVYSGMALVALSGVGAVFLWRRARVDDRAALDREMQVAPELIDRSDVPEYLRRMDDWWRRVDDRTTPDERALIASAGVVVLAELRRGGFLTEHEERAVLRDGRASIWAEPRP